MHLFTSQMVVAFIGLHNRLVDRLRQDEGPEQDIFEQARRAATWHYQHVILREFLPGLIGAQPAAELLDGGPRLYRLERDPYIPFEFADAAYRYGHSQIRDRYLINEHLGPCPVFPDLMGFRPVPPEHAVDWTLQIDVEGHAPAQRAKRIDTRLPAALIALPTQVSGSEPGTDYASLANRDLQRGQAVGLASGEAIARRLGVPALTAEQVGSRRATGGRGRRPCGSTSSRRPRSCTTATSWVRWAAGSSARCWSASSMPIRESFRSVTRAGRPMLPARRAGAFGLADILVPVD